MKVIVNALLTLAALTGCCAYADPDVTLTLIPITGAVQGAPGDTVGWGYTLTNNSGFYLLVDQSNFCGVGGDPAINDCTTPYNPPTEYGPSYGTYADYIGSEGLDIAPGGSAMQNFDSTAMTGVGAYMIDPGAPGGAIDFGNIFVVYDEYMGDPFNGGTFVDESESFATAQVMIAPEPSTFGLAAGSLLAFTALRLRRRRAR